jgi:Holliday junction DNA helicase RuvA
VVREDGHFLYGFASEGERFAFRQLLKITGVGARMALSVLSGLSVGELAQVVARRKSGRLTKIPGIGTKTAERLLLELKGKLADALPSATLAVAEAAVTSSMRCWRWVTMSAKRRRMKQLPTGITTSDGIRQALKLAVKGLNRAQFHLNRIPATSN